MKKSEIVASIDKQLFYESNLGSLPGIRGNGWIKKPIKCPFHNDENPSFSVNLETGRWNCFSQCGGGSIVDFAMKSQGIDFKSALGYLQNFSGAYETNPDIRAKIRREKAARIKAQKKRDIEINFECLMIRFLYLPYEMKGRGVQWAEWKVETRAQYMADRSEIEYIFNIYWDYPEMTRLKIAREFSLRIKILIARYIAEKRIKSIDKV